MCVIISIFILTIDDPLADPDHGVLQFIRMIDVLVTSVFFIEALVKIIALGFFSSSLKGLKPYTKNAWNVIDFLVLITTVFYLRDQLVRISVTWGLMSK